jgi:flagellar biosynthetic protein FlhB
MSGEKTEKPTPKKLKKAQKDGQIGKSQDVGAWAGMFVAGLVIPMTAEDTMKAAQKLVSAWPTVMKNPEPGIALRVLGDGLADGLVALAPLALGLLAAGIAGSAVQGGIKPATGLLKPKFSRMNPLQGFKRIAGPQAVWEASKALIKTVVLAAVLYWSCQDLIPVLMSTGTLPLGALLGTVTDAVFGLIQSAAFAGMVMAGADYAMVKRRTNKQLRMSKQDIKDEYKQSEGDPHVKGQIRARQMAMGRNRMMQDVATADVVMVNPTHVAVALRYDPAKGAPRVVAKGAGAIAAKIRELATENRVPMVQDIPLARTLYKGCEIGQEVPPELYGPIARVLAFIMTLKAKGSAAGMHRNPTAA